MALSFEFKNKEVFAKMSAEDKKNNETYIWAMLAVDMGEITEVNCEEFLWRFVYASKLGGALANIVDGRGNKQEYIPTLAEVKKRIGLHGNLNTITRKQFIKKQVEKFDRWTMPEYMKTDKEPETKVVEEYAI